jgi:pSer/pThr/pTyr-binding forkhead associated (FHA) protein
MKLIIEDDEGRKTVVPFARDEISIGRQEGNTIRLTERNVSRRHARLLRQNESIIIEDLGSYNGVLINGERIDTRSPIREGDLIEIGDYDLAVEGAPVRNMDDTQPSAAMPIFPPDPAPTFVPATTGSNPSVTGPTKRVLGEHESPRLVGVADPFTGIDLRVPKAVTVIGRTTDGADLAIDHPSVGRKHAKLQLEGGVWKIFDLNSANGIEINGTRQTAASLLPGDMIDIGEAKFRFTGPDEIFRPEHPSFAENAGIDQARTSSKLPLIAGVVVALAVLAVVGVLVVQHLGNSQKTETADSSKEDFCTKGQSSAALRNWTEALRNYDVAKQQGQSCTFPLDAAIASAQQNDKAKKALDAADKLTASGQFRQALEALAVIGPDSVYLSEAKLKMAEATDMGVKHLAELAHNAIERNKPDEAMGFIEDLKQLDPSAPMLPQLQKELGEKHTTRSSSGESRNAVASSTPPPAPAPPPQEDSPMQKIVVTKKTTAPSGKSLAERNEEAEHDISEGIQKITGGDLSGGVAKLQAAIGLNPAPTYTARAHRNMGVALAHAKRMDEAIPHLKIYLKLQPDTPEHDRIQKIISDFELAKGGN